MDMRDAGPIPAIPDSDGFDKLDRTIRRLRPTQDDFRSALTALATSSPRRLRRLAHALAETAAADGRVDEIEAEIMDDLRHLGARQYGFGWEG